MRRFICWIKAIPLFIKSGVWCPHLYNEGTCESTIIISTKNGFRVSDNYIHKPHETVHPKATLIRSKCFYCVIEDLSWFDGSHEDIKVIND